MTVERTKNGNSPKNVEIEGVLGELAAIRAEMIGEEIRSKSRLAQIHPNYRESARNLLHYLALRRHDLRPLQLRLAALGLSSLGRAESHVLATVDAVLDVLHRLTGRPQPPSQPAETVDFMRGQRLLAEHTEALVGPASPGRGVRIMVTMPSEAADDYTLIHELLRQGMDCMRINCAHDDAAIWLRMIEHLRRAESSLGRSCRIVMDLAGPKLRTGPLEPGPAVVRIRPRRDIHGKVTAPARVWLTPETAPQPPPSPAAASLPVPADWLSSLEKGVKVHFTDARNSQRTLVVADVTEYGCWAETAKSAYIVPGTNLRCEQEAAAGGFSEALVGSLPPKQNSLILRPGDVLILFRDPGPGDPRSSTAVDAC